MEQLELRYYTQLAEREREVARYRLEREALATRPRRRHPAISAVRRLPALKQLLRLRGGQSATSA